MLPTPYAILSKEEQDGVYSLPKSLSYMDVVPSYYTISHKRLISGIITAVHETDGRKFEIYGFTKYGFIIRFLESTNIVSIFIVNFNRYSLLNNKLILINK